MSDNRVKTICSYREKAGKPLVEYTSYYNQWYLNPNLAMTQAAYFHLNNHKADHKLYIHWNNTNLVFIHNTVYFDITLDRTLSYNLHLDKLRKKIATRDNLLRKLTKFSLRADQHTLNQSAVALCYLVVEYCASV